MMQKLGITDQFLSADELRVAEDGGLTVLERVEGGRYLVSKVQGPPCAIAWATGNLPEPPNNPQVGMANKDLAHEVKSGKFREDLYYRLTPLTIHIPPLRDRKDEIPLFAAFSSSGLTREQEKRFLEYRDLLRPLSLPMTGMAM